MLHICKTSYLHANFREDTSFSAVFNGIESWIQCRLLRFSSYMIWFDVCPRITKHLLKFDHIYMFYTFTINYYVDPREHAKFEMLNTKVRQLWMLNIWVRKSTSWCNQKFQNFTILFQLWDWGFQVWWFQICWNFWGSTNTSVDNPAFKCYFLTFFHLKSFVQHLDSQAQKLLQ